METVQRTLSEKQGGSVRGSSKGEALRVGLFVTTPESRPRSGGPGTRSASRPGSARVPIAPPPPGTTFAPGSRSIVMPLAGGP